MVTISHETESQIEARLRAVICQSRLDVLSGSWAFEEFPRAEFANKENPDALALVRDETVWSQLVPSQSTQAEKFCVFCFHFPKGSDNSGFVGWLASHLKRKFGTGVFVTCGQNTEDGGIFDNWGCPIALENQIVSEVRTLVSPGSFATAGW